MTDTPRFNWRCALGFRPWTKWGAVTKHEMVANAQRLGGVWMSLDAPQEFSEWRQERACLACGKTDRRIVP